jgi:sugar-phosphatase
VIPWKLVRWPVLKRFLGNVAGSWPDALRPSAAVPTPRMIELTVTDGDRSRAIRCRAILFDMDGTLVDSTACVERVWRDWALRRGVDPEALMAVAHGRQNPDVLRLVAPHLDIEREAAALIEEEERCREGIVAVAGAEQLLSALPADRWAIVTSAWQRLAEIRLGCARLPLPPVMVTADDIPRSKPHPDGYLAAAARLGADPADCLVIEDAHAGIEAGRAAGMTVLGIATTFSRAELGCEFCIDDLRAIAVVSA